MFALQSSEFPSPEMSHAPQTQDATAAPADGAGDLLAFPASIAQQVFWYLELLRPTTSCMNCCGVWKGRST